MRADLEELKGRIDRGDYEVDPHAIARAIIGRRGRGQAVSDVLVPAEVDRGAVGADEPEPAPGRDRA